jgi:hypothetical protein
MTTDSNGIGIDHFDSHAIWYIVRWDGSKADDHDIDGCHVIVDLLNLRFDD